MGSKGRGITSLSACSQSRESSLLPMTARVYNGDKVDLLPSKTFSFETQNASQKARGKFRQAKNN